MSIYQKMHQVMKAVSYVQKEEKMVNNQYRFVSHDAVTAKLRPHLIEAGVLVVPRVTKHSQDGNRTEVDIEVDFVNVEKPEDRITIPMFGFGIDPQDKGPGKAVSYAVKYALLKAFSLETGDDPERDLIDHKPAPKAKPEKTYGKGVHKPTDGAVDALTASQVQRVAEVAAAIHDWLKAGSVADAVCELENADFETEEKIYCWTFFDSAQRSAMKKEHERQKALAQAAELATQA